MTAEHDTVSGLEDLVAATRTQAATETRQLRRWGKAPSPRVLNAGGFVLRMAGVLIVIGGCWGFIWTVIELIMLLGGERSGLKFQTASGVISLRMQGWPAVIYGTIWSVAVWCTAVVVFALGHASYVLRDLAAAANSGEPTAG